MKRFLSDASFTGLSQLILSLTQIVLQIFVVRFTSQHEFGSFVTATSIENLIEVIFITRSAELALQYIGKYWVDGDILAAIICAERIRWLDLKVNLSVYACIVVFSLLISKFFELPVSYLIGLGLQIPAQIGYGVSKSIFISINKIREQAIFEISFSLTQFFLCLLGVYWQGIHGLITALVVSAAFKTLLAQIITERWWLPIDYSCSGIADQQKLVNTQSWWNFSMHSMLRNAFVSAANQADVLILSAFQGAESTATYKIARSLSSLPLRAIAPIWSALRPRIMYTHHQGNYQKLLKLIAIPAGAMLGILIVALVPAYFLADDLIIAMYGKSYVSSTFPFLILLIGTWIYGGMAAWFNFWIIVSEQNKLGTLISGFLLFTTLTVGILIGTKSVVSMALATSCSMIMTSILCCFFFIRYLKTNRRTRVNKGI